MGYYDNSKAYKIWIPRTKTILKARDAIFDESNHIERVTIHATDDDMNYLISVPMNPPSPLQPIFPRPKKLLKSRIMVPEMILRSHPPYLMQPIQR